MKHAHPQLRLIGLAVSAAFAHSALAQTTPSFNSTQAGNATVTQSGVATTVSQTSQRAVLLWNSLSLGNGASLTYNQPNSSAIAVNRVSAAGGLSTIDGSLTANGNVMILNPNGVLFGSHASVNVAGLVASTGDIDSTNNFAAFMATNAPVVITGATAGSIVNQGNITVTGAGLVAFVAPSVSNAGVIIATSGRITLASAQAATISLNGGLYEIAVTQGVAGGSISNTGTLSAPGGAILITALDASNIVSGAINLEGIQQASRIEVNGGRVTLKGDLDAATVAGASAIVDVCHCAQIQDGIDIVKNGGTVNVADGTYTQTKTLNVNKSITLVGASQTNTIIDARGVTSAGGGYGMLVNADNVTLSDFTLYGPVVDAASAYGIKVQPAGAAATSRVNNFSIARVTSRGAGRAELDLNGVNGANIDTVTANGAPVGNDAGTTKGAGIQLTDSANVTIKNSITRNNAWGGVALFQTNRFFDQQTANISVQNNNLFTEALPLYMQDESASLNFGALSLQGFNYAVKNSDSASGNNQYTWLQYTLGGAFDLAVNTPVATQSYIQGWNVSATNGNFYVGVGNLSGGGTQALSIAKAIDTAVTGNTVNVAAGTFTQTSTLNVNKGITLVGAGEANTTIDTRTVTGYGMLVNADNVTLSDFTLYGPVVDAASAYGIKVQPAGSAASSRLNNFSIARVTSRGAGRAELDLNGVNGATIDGVTANGAPVGNDSGTTKGAGIQITDSNSVTIRNSTTRNNAWGGVALYQSNRFYDQQTGNIMVESNNHFNESNPLYMQDESASKNFGALTLQGFNYAVKNSDSASGNDQYTWMQYTLGGAFDLAVNTPAAAQSYIQGWNVSATNSNFYVGVGHLAAGGTQAMSIMKAVDTAAVGNTINIAPGNYTETAMHRTIPGTGGTYDLGLYINKDNLTLRGIDAAGNPITSADSVQAWITAGAATNFGMNHGIGSNNVTIEGLGFKPNVAGANKTIEIAGDNFTFRNSVVDNRSVDGGAGALYFGELDPVGHPMTRLNVIGSIFYDGSVVLTNGVGADGTSYSAASNRVISGNAFIGSSNYTFGGLLLNGQMAEIPWRTMPIGAAIITGNSFSGFDESVLVRGNQQGVDLRQVMASNSFDRAVLVTDSSGNARGETYQSTPDGTHFTPRLKYSIQSSLQSGVNRAVSGDTVAVGAGTYAENVVVNAPLNFVFGGSTVRSMVFNANTGIAGSATADGVGFRFNAPVVLMGNTSLSTMGGNIAFNGDIQNVGTTPYALSLSSGSGDITLLSGGSQANPIGFFRVDANDFTLNSTLWVTGFNVGASGNIALSDHSLHATSLGSVNVISASGGVTGAVFSQSVIVVNAGGDVQIIIDAPTGSSVKAGGAATVQNVGTGVLEVNGESRPNTQFASVTNNRIVPPDNALPRASVVPVAPVSSGGGTEIQLPAEAAGDALDQGFPVEVDLTPGPKLRRR